MIIRGNFYQTKFKKYFCCHICVIIMANECVLSVDALTRCVPNSTLQCVTQACKIIKFIFQLLFETLNFSNCSYKLPRPLAIILLLLWHHLDSYHASSHSAVLSVLVRHLVHVNDAVAWPEGQQFAVRREFGNLK